MSCFRVVCLVSPGSPVTNVDLERAALAPLGAETTLAIAGTEAETLAATREADAIFHRGGVLSAAVIRQLRRCRIIAHGGVGYDALDVDAAAAKGIIVTNVAEYCVDEVSDHALLLLMALSRRLMPQIRLTRDGHWNARDAGTARRLRGAIVAVVGYGRIGSAFGRKAHALGLRVIAVDPYLEPAKLVEQGADPRELHDALLQADFVSLHVPLNESTRHLIGAAELALMKPPAYLINTARGGIVDEAALVRALTSHQIAGAGIDVLEHEPPDPEHPLLKLDNVIVTPHAAYYSEASIVDVRRTMAEQVVDALSGKWPRFVVNQPAIDHEMLKPA